jgi:peptidoglycan/xylan/chitin deacetylase (PgdA/CDA1 family)
VLVASGSGAALTGLVLGILMALATMDGVDTTASAGDTTAGGGDTSADGTTGSDSADGTVDGTVDSTELGLNVPGVIRTTGRSGQNVALTFSSGPDPQYTPPILQILDAQGVKATFCILGSQAEKYPELVRQIAAGGHVLCNHTLNYDYSLASRDDATQRAEIGGGLAAIRAAEPDAAVPFFRAPGGNFSPELVDVAASSDMASLGWSVDPKDWTTPGAPAIETAVVNAVQPGSIVVLHDEGPNRGGTVEALDEIIDALQAEGYQFVTPAS